jgi:predicted RNase H-like HicB family nuclease
MVATMTEPRRFEVVFEPDEGGAWNASIPAVPGCLTWGRSLVAARRYIREALSTCVDVLGEDAERIARDAVFDEKFELDKKSQEVLEGYLAARKKTAELQRLLQLQATMAAKLLTKKLSLRDAGELLGLSHERVSQVLKSQDARVRVRESYEEVDFATGRRTKSRSASAAPAKPAKRAKAG